MLESYFEEIKRKQRFKGLFWILVFFFATLLFLFFKGYYISFNLDWEKFLSQENSLLSQSGSDIASINSFGIIYIKAHPNDTQIYLQQDGKSKKYTNGEKLFTSYGDYVLNLEKNGFIPGEMSFSINNDINFYTDTVNMMKIPTYLPIPQLENKNIFAFGNDSWIVQEGNIFTLYHQDFLSGSIIHSGSELKHIGEGNFLSGNTLMKYNTLAGDWIFNKNPIVQNFINTCVKLSYKSTLLHCQDTNTSMTESGKAFTGVISYGKNFLKQKDAVIVGDFTKNDTKKYILNNKTQSGNIFIEIDKQWYTNNNGKLINLEKDNQKSEISLGDFSEILFAENTNSAQIFITKRGDERFLIISTMQGSHKTRILNFPNINLDDVRIYENKGNFFIKTQNALLFIYKEGQKIHWIIDGTILAVGENFAIYQKNNTVMQALWEEKTK